MCIRDRSHCDLDNQATEIDEAIFFAASPLLRIPLPLSLIHISEPTRLGMISYAVFHLYLHRLDRRQRQMCIRYRSHCDLDNQATEIDEAIFFAASPLLRIPLPLSLIHISEPTRLGMISYAVFC